MARDEWTCPRCGLTGDHMKSPDPDRCRTCCKIDAVEDLYEALGACLAYLWPAPDEGHTGFVDRLGMEFYRETGVWPPFKSAPMETYHHEADRVGAQKQWDTWISVKRNAAAAKASRALATARGES